VGWAKKISAQRNRSGEAERIRHHPGRKPHAGIEGQQKVMAWVSAKPDLTLSEIQMKYFSPILRGGWFLDEFPDR